MKTKWVEVFVLLLVASIAAPAFAQDEQESTKTPAIANSGSEKFESKLFDAPIRLMVEETPLNVAARQMYPSPAMFDIDGDGAIELVVGDIFGTLNVYENENKDGGDPVWSSHTPLKSADGEPIKVSNW